MKILSKLLFALALLAGLILGLWASTAKAVQAPQSNSSITNPPYGPNDLPNPRKTMDTNTYSSRSVSGRHSTRANTKVGVSSLQNYLETLGSPLAPYSSQILESPYWSTILGICTIEQYGCTKAPGNNYWGIGPGKRYDSIPSGISAISGLLEKYESLGKTTIESLNGFYVVPASNNWLNTVLKTKQELESL